jgi:hypothetical protein
VAMLRLVLSLEEAEVFEDSLGGVVAGRSDH